MMPQNDIITYSLSTSLICFFLSYVISYLSVFENIIYKIMFLVKHLILSQEVPFFSFLKEKSARNWLPINFVILNDFPEKLDIGFQDPATGLIESLILLHHDIMFFELIILVTVLYFFYFILYWYVSRLPLISKKQSNLNFNISPLLNITHAPELEIVWTSLPAILLTVIAIPSILLLFRSDRLHVASLIIKVVGNQWFWHFDYCSKIQVK